VPGRSGIWNKDRLEKTYKSHRHC